MPSAKYVLASGLAAGGTGDTHRIKAEAPFLIQTGGGYTGTTTVEHSVDGTNWVTLQAMSSGDMYDVGHPIKYLRVNGTHTGSAANVYLLEEVIG